MRNAGCGTVKAGGVATFHAGHRLVLNEQNILETSKMITLPVDIITTPDDTTLVCSVVLSPGFSSSDTLSSQSLGMYSPKSVH